MLWCTVPDVTAAPESLRCENLPPEGNQERPALDSIQLQAAATGLTACVQPVLAMRQPVPWQGRWTGRVMRGNCMAAVAQVNDDNIQATNWTTPQHLLKNWKCMELQPFSRFTDDWTAWLFAEPHILPQEKISTSRLDAFILCCKSASRPKVLAKPMSQPFWPNSTSLNSVQTRSS